MSKENRHVTLNVEGMTCTNCALGVTKSLQQKGLRDVHVDFTTGEVTFEEIKGGATAEQAKETISSLGYRVTGAAGNNAEKKELSPIEKKFLFCLAFTVPLFLHMFVPHGHFLNNPYLQLFLCLPVFTVGMLHFGRSAWGSLRSGTANMDVLITIGAAAAFIYSLVGTIQSLGHDYLFYETSATIITLVLLGSVLEHRSVKKTTTAISELTKMQPAAAKKIVNPGATEHTEEIKAEQINPGDLLLVNTGDKIPADGEITWGYGSIDESMITGESIPVEKTINDKVIGGTILSQGNLKIRAEKTGSDTVLSHIIEMVKKAQRDKPSIQKLGDKVSAVFVPIVILIAFGTFAVWYFVLDETLQQSIMNSVAVLVISCPCAMGLATPTAVMVGIGRAAKTGLLIKGGSTLELLTEVKSIAFDKTGTVTTGNFKIKELQIADDENKQEITNVIYSLEKHSSHPIAKSLLKEFSGRAANVSFSEVREEKGLGISASDNSGNSYLIGSYRAAKHLTGDAGYDIYLVKNSKIVAKIKLEDDIKNGAEAVISELKEKNINVILLSGDKEDKCAAVAKKLQADKYYCGQKPDEKIRIIEELSAKSSTAMVGDGINDAPALARATVGISLGNASQVAIQSAQVIILDENNLFKIVEALNISRHTLLTIKQNLFWAFFYNIAAIPIAAMGLLNPMVAALAMAFSDVIVVGNSLRLRTKKIN